MKTVIKLIILMALAAGGYYGFTIYKEKTGSGKNIVKDVNAISNTEMERLATEFLKTFSDKDIDRAYMMVTKEFKIKVPPSELSRLIAIDFSKKKFKELRSIGFSYSKRYFEDEPQDTRTARTGEFKWLYMYSGIITFTDGTEKKTLIALAKDGGQWKVQHLEIAKSNITPGSPDNSDRNIKDVSNSEVEQVVAAFLKTLANKDIDGAYKMIIEKFETVLPRDEMPRFITQAFGGKKLKELRNNGFSYSKRYFDNEQQGARTEHWVYIYSGIITFTDESEKEFDIALRKEGGQWKVQHIEIDTD